MSIESWILVTHFGFGFITALVLFVGHWYVGHKTHLRDVWYFCVITLFGVVTFVVGLFALSDMIGKFIKNNVNVKFIGDISHKFYVWGQITLFKGRGK